MNLVDIAILVIIVVSLLMGLFRGLVREVLSLFSWAGALYIAYVFCLDGAVYLESYIDQPPFRIVLTFVGLFIVSLIVFSIISYILYKMFALAGVSGVDRSLGTVFGLARGVVIVAALILGANFMDITTQPWWQESMLVSHFSVVTEFIRALLPADIVKFVSPKAT